MRAYIHPRSSAPLRPRRPGSRDPNSNYSLRMNKYLLGLGVCALAFGGCDDEEPLPAFPEAPCEADLQARTISGAVGPLTVGDRYSDSASGLSASGGTAADAPITYLNSSVLVVDASGTITNVFNGYDALAANDFDGAAAGTYQIYDLVSQYTLGNFGEGSALDGITGCFALSSPVTFQLNPCGTSSGSIAGPDIAFDVSDGDADNIDVGALTVTPGSGDDTRYVVTDLDGTILATYDDLDDVGDADFGSADFNSSDTIRLHVVSTAGPNPIAGDTTGANVADVQGCYTPSEGLIIARNCDIEGGTLTVDTMAVPGGVFRFITNDGEPDFVSDITLSGNTGAGGTYVITDADGNILGLPSTLADLEAVDFDGAGEGTCLIWWLSIGSDLSGAAVGANASDIRGCAELSNPIEVRRL